MSFKNTLIILNLFKSIFHLPHYANEKCLIYGDIVRDIIIPLHSKGIRDYFNTKNNTDGFNYPNSNHICISKKVMDDIENILEIFQSVGIFISGFENKQTSKSNGVMYYLKFKINWHYTNIILYTEGFNNTKHFTCDYFNYDIHTNSITYMIDPKDTEQQIKKCFEKKTTIISTSALFSRNIAKEYFFSIIRVMNLKGFIIEYPSDMKISVYPPCKCRRFI